LSADVTFMMYSENNKTSISITVQIRAVLAVIPSCSGENLRQHHIVATKLSKHAQQKAIVDYTLPALCTPITAFPPIGDSANHQHVGGGPSHEHKQHAQKIW